MVERERWRQLKTTARMSGSFLVNKENKFKAQQGDWPSDVTKTNWCFSFVNTALWKTWRQMHARTRNDVDWNVSDQTYDCGHTSVNEEWDEVLESWRLWIRENNAERSLPSLLCFQESIGSRDDFVYDVWEETQMIGDVGADDFPLWHFLRGVLCDLFEEFYVFCILHVPWLDKFSNRPNVSVSSMHHFSDRARFENNQSECHCQTVDWTDWIQVIPSWLGGTTSLHFSLEYIWFDTKSLKERSWFRRPFWTSLNVILVSRVGWVRHVP